MQATTQDRQARFVRIAAVCAAFAASTVGSPAAPGSGQSSASLEGGSGETARRGREVPPKVIYGVLRDFHQSDSSGGHPDFQKQPEDGLGVQVGIVANQLGDDGKPLCISTGHREVEPSEDADGRRIIGPKPYMLSKPDDVRGQRGVKQSGSIDGPDSFAQWYNDAPTVNTSYAFPLALEYKENAEDGPCWKFDGDLASRFSKVPGLGNKGVTSYTLEMEVSFVYERGAGDVITIGANDSVWAYIEGNLVVDLGGCHPFKEQVVELDRLPWLRDGSSYRLKIFYAERIGPDARLKISSTVDLNRAPLPAVSALYD